MTPPLLRMEIEAADGRRFTVGLHQGHDLSIPICFDRDRPRAFGLPPAEGTPFAAGGFVGDVRRGGSCDCFRLTLHPHGDGTHTEGVGHVVEEHIAVAASAPEAPLLARLVSLPVRPLDEDYQGPGHSGRDLALHRLDLARRLGDGVGAPALILRSLPNDATKLQRDYSNTNPPYLSSEAIGWIREQGVDHLLVDLPSVDREDDDGRLANHRRFFGVDPGVRGLGGQAPLRRSITELVWIPDEIPDGLYLLDLQVPDIRSDAAPSRPRIYPLVER